MIADEILKLIERCKELGVEEYSQDGTSFKVKFRHSTSQAKTPPLKTPDQALQDLPGMTQEMIESLIGDAPPDLKKMGDRELLLQGTGGWEALQEEELEKKRIEHAFMNQSGAV